MAKYIFTHGDKDSVEIPDVLDLAMDYTRGVILDLHLPQWREFALLVQVANMPRAGMSFTDNAGRLVRIQRTT